MPQGTKKEHICKRCSRVYKTCCRTEPENTANCFPLSISELRALNRCLPGIRASQEETNTPEFIGSLQRLLPNQREIVGQKFPEQGTHLRLNTDYNGACVFLDPNGCLLPREYRPLYCRLYPFWVYKGKVTLFDNPNCLALQETRSVNGLVKLFNTSTNRILELHELMLKNLALK
ncbi:MAG: YkgJ family cysteine cluster protein [Desulfonatronovibrionaceae bacterium]